jgi:hypothetical protein
MTLPPSLEGVHSPLSYSWWFLRELIIMSGISVAAVQCEFICLLVLSGGYSGTVNTALAACGIGWLLDLWFVVEVVAS